jgi:glutamate dehydrogenase (NADP+)
MPFRPLERHCNGISTSFRIEDYLKHSPRATFVEGKRPWEVPCDVAFPSATQNEIDESDAKVSDELCSACAVVA